MDDLDRHVLVRLQTGLPLVPEPFDAVASDLDVRAPMLLDRVRSLKTQGIVREISGLFDTRRLGYASTLVAARIPKRHLDQAIQAINAHPGVTHNYGRDHGFNVWFTLAVPPDSTLGPAGTVERLRDATGAETMRRLGVVKLYKIGVRLPLTPDAAPPRETPAAESPVRWSGPSALDRQVVRALNRDLPVQPNPFEHAAQDVGMSVADLLAEAQRLTRARVLRRFAAAVDHQRVGFATNAMAVWRVEADRADAAGAGAAACPAVSHCYQRETHPDWPYNLFAMVHARTRAECETVLADLARRIGQSDRAVLYTTAEYKKARLRYFTADTATWESKHGAGPGD